MSANTGVTQTTQTADHHKYVVRTYKKVFRGLSGGSESSFQNPITQLQPLSIVLLLEGIPLGRGKALYLAQR